MVSTGAFARTAWLGVLAATLIGGRVDAAGLSHFPDPVFHDGMENVADGPATDADAARFLAQATFGPTDADIAHLRALGYQAWLDEQFAAAPTSEVAYYNWVSNTLGEIPGIITVREAWFLGALGGPDPQNNMVIHRDQLRQRVAFALSEIMVVSDRNSTLQGFPNALAYYHDILSGNAFGNYRTLLEQVTLSPAMGVFLNMMGNQRADLANNIHPDENYAREINQLFSIGLTRLDLDGTELLDAGKPIPTYSQATVTAFAHVFTGWNWSDCDPGSFQWCGPDYQNGTNLMTPMVPVAQYHDNGTKAGDDLPNKQLLSYQDAVNGGVLANNGTPQSDLAFALDNIFHHPNVGPFISKQLIQRLVTSNPSPAYVGRVAAVFNNDGSPQQVRGNLAAVARAILLDPEARLGQFGNPTTFGKLREPLLRLTHLWRAMGARHHCGLNYLSDGRTYHFANQPYRYAGYVAWGTDDEEWSYGVGQAPLDAISVFNFFKPSYLPPGEMTSTKVLGPEFQIHTDSVSINSTNSTFDKSWRDDVSESCEPTEEIGYVAINHAQDASLAGSANGGVADPADRLVDAYNVRFMSGQMSPFMRQTLLAFLNQISANNYGSNWKYFRISWALLLIQTSPEYMIQK